MKGKLFIYSLSYNKDHNRNGKSSVVTDGERTLPDGKVSHRRIGQSEGGSAFGIFMQKNIVKPQFRTDPATQSFCNRLFGGPITGK